MPGRGVEQSKVSHGREGYIVGIDEKLGLAGTPHVVEAYIHGASWEQSRVVPCPIACIPWLHLLLLLLLLLLLHTLRRGGQATARAVLLAHLARALARAIIIAFVWQDMVQSWKVSIFRNRVALIKRHVLPLRHTTMGALNLDEILEDEAVHPVIRNPTAQHNH